MADDKRQNNILNPYYLYPTTVPPYVLDLNFQKLRLNNSKDIDIQYEDGDWGGFVNDVGVNVCYVKQKMVNDLNKEYLPNLNSNWGGEERLKAIHDIPLVYIKDFESNRERKEWVEHINKVKRYFNNHHYFHHHRNYQNREANNQFKKYSISSSAYYHNWIEEVNKEKAKWSSLRKNKFSLWRPKLMDVFFSSQYLVLTLRSIVVLLCICTIVLVTQILGDINNDNGRNPMALLLQRSNLIMNLYINSLAIVYNTYISFDEFTGKPLGLRSPISKIRLILIDLLFIIFENTNFCFSFNSFTNNRRICGNNSGVILLICQRQRVLTILIFVLELLWITIFAISITRVIEKVESDKRRINTYP